MAAKIDQAFEFWNDEAGQVAPPEPVTVKGVWNPMDAQTERYFREALAGLEISETEFDKMYFYELDTKNIGGLNAPLFWFLMAGAVGLAVFAVASGVRKSWERLVMVSRNSVSLRSISCPMLRYFFRR